MSVAFQIMTKGIIKINKVNRKPQLWLQGKTVMCMCVGVGGQLCSAKAITNKQNNKTKANLDHIPFNRHRRQRG